MTIGLGFGQASTLQDVIDQIQGGASQQQRQPIASGFAPPAPQHLSGDDIDEMIRRNQLAAFGGPLVEPQRQAEAPEEKKKDDGIDPVVMANLAAALPGLGSQLGRLFDTLSDERSKTDVSSADDDIEHLLDVLAGGR